MKDLQNLCLSKILQNFKRYHLAYSTSEDRCLKLKFEFLRKWIHYSKKYKTEWEDPQYKERAYSAQIVAMFDEEFDYRIEYFDFVFNKYLKRLHTLWLEDCPWNTISKKIAEIGPSLEEIIFEDGKFPWESLFSHLPNLKRVNFTYDCSDKILLGISKFCPNIESINIELSKCVSDDGLKQLCHKNDGRSSCPVLKELLIEYTNVTDKGVKYLLKNLPSLEKIYYPNIPEILYSIHKNDINTLDKIKPYNITHLNVMFMTHNQILDDVLKICATLCPHLKSLSSPVLKQEHLDMCSQFHVLENLYLDCCKEPSLAFYQFLKLIGNRLMSWRISNKSTCFSVFAHSCPRLDSSLQMDKVGLQHTINDSMSVFHKLKSISFEDFNLIDPVITQSVIYLLSSSPNLNVLCFRNCDSFSLEIKTLILRHCEKSKVNVIDFSGSDVEFKLLQDVLLTCSTLESLILHMCNITHNFLAMIQLEHLATALPFRTRIFYTVKNNEDEEMPEDIPI